MGGRNLAFNMGRRATQLLQLLVFEAEQFSKTAGQLETQKVSDLLIKNSAMATRHSSHHRNQNWNDTFLPAKAERSMDCAVMGATSALNNQKYDCITQESGLI